MTETKEDLYAYGQLILAKSVENSRLLSAVLPILNERIFVTSELIVPKMPDLGIPYWIPGQTEDALKVWKNIVIDTWLTAFDRKCDHDVPLVGVRRGRVDGSMSKMRAFEAGCKSVYVSQMQQDAAWDLGVNPISCYAGQGHVIWGYHLWRDGNLVRVHPTQANPWQYACPSAFASLLPPEFVRLA